jgi:endonuclease G
MPFLFTPPRLAFKSVFALGFAAALAFTPLAGAQTTPPGAAPVEALVPLDDNLALGNPSGALASLDNKDLNNLLVRHPAFALSYNQSNGGPNWVSWHLAQSDRGRTGRSENFRPDPLLPPEARIRPNDYRGTGYDRGHQCPSGDRTADEAANASTFLMSNMLPQTPDLNRQLWRKFEEYCRSQLRAGANELYIVTGGTGSVERIANGKVNVPASCWKVAVILPSGDNDLARINASTRVVSILAPNKNGVEISGGDWRTYLTSVDTIEEATKLDLLSNLPVEVQKVLEARVDTGRATRQTGATETDKAETDNTDQK